MNYPNLAVAPRTPTNIFLLHQFAGNNLPGDWLQTQNAVGHWHGRWGVQIGGAGWPHGRRRTFFLLHQFAGNNLPGDGLQTQNAVGHWHGRWGVQIGGAASDAAAPSPIADWPVRHDWPIGPGRSSGQPGCTAALDRDTGKSRE
jgi:hypothetical protein